MTPGMASTTSEAAKAARSDLSGLEALMEHRDPGVALTAGRLREHARRVEAREGEPEFRVARKLQQAGWWAHHHNAKQAPRPGVRTFGLRREVRDQIVERRGRFMGTDEEHLEFLRTVWAAFFETEGVSPADMKQDSLEKVLDHLEDLHKEEAYGPAWHLGGAAWPL